jgi:hypothetical protein
LQKLFAHEHRQNGPDDEFHRLMRVLAAQGCELALQSEQIAMLMRWCDELRRKGDTVRAIDTIAYIAMAIVLAFLVFWIVG